jgi:hypothetical protein
MYFQAKNTVKINRYHTFKHLIKRKTGLKNNGMNNKMRVDEHEMHSE